MLALVSSRKIQPCVGVAILGWVGGLGGWVGGLGWVGWGGEVGLGWEDGLCVLQGLAGFGGGSTRTCGSLCGGGACVGGGGRRERGLGVGLRAWGEVSASERAALACLDTDLNPTHSTHTNAHSSSSSSSSSSSRSRRRRRSSSSRHASRRWGTPSLFLLPPLHASPPKSPNSTT